MLHILLTHARTNRRWTRKVARAEKTIEVNTKRNESMTQTSTCWPKKRDVQGGPRRQAGKMWMQRVCGWRTSWKEELPMLHASTMMCFYKQMMVCATEVHDATRIS